MPIPIIIDTDPGIDDAIAIMLAAASPEVKILAVTAVAGNVGLDTTARNALSLADLLRLDCPVGRGASGPLWRRDRNSAQEVHGNNGLGGYSLKDSAREAEPALPLMARLIEESVEPVTIVAIGPLTNIALLINEYPETARKVKRFVIMGGGTQNDLGNATASAEFNMYYDPDAAARVFDFGVPITMVGLNVTHRALLGRQHLPQLFASGGVIAEIVGHVMDDYLSRRNDGGGMAQHDPLAMAAAIDPGVISTRLLPVDVENTGRLTSGMTVVDYRSWHGEGGAPRIPNCDVALEVDVERFRSLMNTRLAHLDSSLKGHA